MNYWGKAKYLFRVILDPVLLAVFINHYRVLQFHKTYLLLQGVLDYRDDRIQKKFPDNRGYILYYSAQNDQKFPVIVRNV